MIFAPVRAALRVLAREITGKIALGCQAGVAGCAGLGVWVRREFGLIRK